MRVYYDRDADLNLIKGKKVAVVGYGSQGPCPCAQHARQRHQGYRRGAARRLRLCQEGRGRRPQSDERRGRRQMGRRRHDAHAGRAAGRHLQGRPRAQHEERRRAVVRTRTQRPFQFDRTARRHRRADGSAQRPRSHRTLRVPEGRRRALPHRHRAGRVRQRPRPWTLLRLGDRRRACRYHRDEFSRRNARRICSASRLCFAAAWSS